MKKRLLSAIVAAWVAGAMMTQPVHAEGATGTAVLKGKISYKGDPPKIKPIKMTGDAHCQKQKTQPDQGTIVYKEQGNAIPYAFVYIKKGVDGKFDAPSDPVVLDQKGCMYHPHVFGMIAGQPLKILNSDPTNHNVHSLAKKNPQFNFAQPNEGMVRMLESKDTFTREEIMVKIKCDVHAWMSTYVGVMGHPFFGVSLSHENDGDNKDARGTYEIKNLPAGEYEVACWHENFGEMSQKIKIADGETKELNFEYGGSAAVTPPNVREVQLGSADDGETFELAEGEDFPKNEGCCSGAHGAATHAK